MNKISVIIPTMKGREESLEKLLSTLPEGCEKIVVNDADLLLAAKRNKGAGQVTGDYLFFIDDDNYLKDFALSEMMKCWREDIGVMGMTACYHDKKRIIADGGSKRNYLTGFTKGLFTNRGAMSVSGYTYWADEVANAFMIPRHVFEEAGGFDEENFPIDLDEADICKRIKDMGYSIVMCPSAICYHHSQTYSALPDFRRRLNAYTLANHKLRYARKHLNSLSYWMHVIIFFPLHICIYTVALLWRKKFQMLIPFYHGVLDGFRNRRTDKYFKEI